MAIIRDPSATELPTARQPSGIARLAAIGPSEAPGKGLEALGIGLEQASQDLYRAQERDDTIRVEDAWNRYKTSALDVTLGDKGVLKLSGGDAVNGNILQQATSALESSKKQILDGLGNDEQRTRFSARAQSTDQMVAHQVLVHLDTERKQYAKVTMNGSEAAAQAQIVAMPENLSVFAQARDTLMHQADAFMKGQGVTDKAAIDAYKDKLSDGLWAKRIDALVYSNPLLADALLRANSGGIKNPELKLQLQGKTREASLGVSANLVAQDIIDEVRSKTPVAGLAATGRNPYQVPGDRSDEEVVQGNIAELKRELARKDNTPAMTRIKEAELQSEQAKLGAFRRVSSDEQALAPSTNGLPNSRDIAAQLPFMQMRVEKKADEIYGTDKGNPDRQAFIKKTTTELHSKVAADVQQLNSIQRQAQGTLIDAVAGLSIPGPGGGMVQVGGSGPGKAGSPGQPLTSFSQIQANPTLLAAFQLMDPAAKVGVLKAIESNARADDKGNQQLYWDTFNRIHLEPGDPKKVDFYGQIISLAGPGKLSTQQLTQLRLEIDRTETPGGRSIVQMRKAADATAASWFKNAVMFTAQPEKQLAATMRWTEDVGRKIDEYVKAGKDVRSLFAADKPDGTPGSPDSVVSSQFMYGYVNSTPAIGLAEGAAKVKAAQPAAVAPIERPATIDTVEKLDAWVKTQTPGAPFKWTDGRTYRVPARAAPAQGAATPAQPVMLPTGKLVDPAPAQALSAPIEDPEMPKLVSPAKRVASGTEGPSWSEVGGAVADTTKKAAGAVAKGSKAVRDVASGAVVSAAEALTPPGDPEKAAGSFRAFVKAGQYTQASGPTIQDAIDSGLLNAKELKIARKMLKSIEGAK